MKRFNNNQTLKATFTSIGVIAFFIITCLTSQTVKAQTTYTIAPGSQITVEGTSNLHDWTMTATSFSSEGKLTVTRGELKDINSLIFTLPVKNLKSKESLMDTRAYKALNESGFNKMTFKLTDASVIESQKLVKVTGNLTISGVTKAIALQANYTLADETILFKGSKAIKMSDFKIKAPQFMLGALKTGDDLNIVIALKLKK